MGSPILRAHRLALFGLAGLLACSGTDASAPADLVVYGRVWTGDSARPWAAGVAVAGDSIVAVGDSAEVACRTGQGTQVLALRGSARGLRQAEAARRVDRGRRVGPRALARCATPPP